MKDFDTWNAQKQILDISQTYLHPRAGEIWWVCIGMNVGLEIYGKGDMYLRPVLIINAEDNNTFVGIPLTSKIKNSRYGCVIRTSDDRLHTALTHQVRVFDRKRLWRLKYILSIDEYGKVHNIFSSIYIIQYPQVLTCGYECLSVDKGQEGQSL